MRTHEPVHLVALGARTCLGMRASTSAAAVSARMSRLAEHSYYVDGTGAPIVTAADPRLADLPLGQRLRVLVVSALDDLLAASPLLGQRRLPVLLALPPARPGVPGEVEALVRQACSDRLGPFAEVEAISRAGHTAGLIALERAHQRLAAGREALCLVLAVDSYLDIDTLEWMESGRLLHAPGTHSAFIPGEAASACLLATEAARRELGLPSWALVRAAAVRREDRCPEPDAARAGAALGEALRSVLTAAPPAARQDIYCDLNGQRHRAEEYAFAALRVRDLLHEPGRFSAPATSWGDVGAATGVLLITLAAVRAARGRARSEDALVWCASDATERAAVLLHTPRP